METGEGGVLEHKSGNISETRRDRGKVNMEGLYELINALSKGTILLLVLLVGVTCSKKPKAPSFQIGSG